MIDTSSFENAVTKYLSAVIERNDDQACLVWNYEADEYERWNIHDVEVRLDDFNCSGNHLVMWLIPKEARFLYEQRQQKLKV